MCIYSTCLSLSLSLGTLTAVESFLTISTGPQVDWPITTCARLQSMLGDFLFMQKQILHFELKNKLEMVKCYV